MIPCCRCSTPSPTWSRPWSASTPGCRFPSTGGFAWARVIPAASAARSTVAPTVIRAAARRRRRRRSGGCRGPRTRKLPERRVDLSSRSLRACPQPAGPRARPRRGRSGRRPRPGDRRPGRPLADHAQGRVDPVGSAPREAQRGHPRVSGERLSPALPADARGRAAACAEGDPLDHTGGGPLRWRPRRWGRRGVSPDAVRPDRASAGPAADPARSPPHGATVADRPTTPPPARRILLADADAFYVSVARLVDPEGVGKAPLLIVGGSVERRGVVTSASYEARAYGVHSAMPMARAIRLCPGAMVVPVPWEACAAKGRQVRDVLLRFTPAIEQASSDEFYLDFTGTDRLYRDESLANTARRMREAVIGETALSLSIGAGTSKLVAKLAAGLAKPRPGAPGSGVHVVAPGAEGGFMRRFALADIPLVGPKSQARLARFGLRTVEDVLRHDRPTLVRWLGEREGQWLYERVRGIDRSLVEPDREIKSISRDETFARDLDRDDALGAKLLALSDRAATDLREAGLLTHTVTVKIRDADFTTRQASRTLPEPVSSDRVVYAVARELLARLRQARRVPARLLGVGLSQLVRLEAGMQPSLFESPEPARETERDRQIARVIDEVRQKFGPDALGRGGARENT